MDKDQVPAIDWLKREILKHVKDIEVAGIITGLAAEYAQKAYLQGHSRGYTQGYDKGYGKVSFKTWAFQRPYCYATNGFVQAKTGPEALELVHAAYGFCNNATVFCAETKETWNDKGLVIEEEIEPEHGQ